MQYLFINCLNTSGQASYNTLTLGELKIELREQPRAELFMKKRTRCIEILTEKGLDASLGPEDFEDAEVVEQEEATGEKRGRPGALYREDRFFEAFPDAKKRKSLSFNIELIGKDKWYRVFDFADGILRFENYVDTATKHRKTIDDGSMRLSDDQVGNTYENTVKQNMDHAKLAKCLTASDLGEATGSASAGPAGAKTKVLSAKKSNESSGSSSSAEAEEEAAPLAKAQGKAKAKGKAKAQKKDKITDAVVPLPDSDEEAMEDTPANKKDGAFLKQTNLKIAEIQRALAAISDAKSMKDINSALFTSLIRQIDGKQQKVIQCGLLNCKRNVAKALVQMRGVTKLVKCVKEFELQSRVTGKSVQASALMTTGFQNFEAAKIPLSTLPWCIRIVFFVCF